MNRSAGLRNGALVGWNRAVPEAGAPQTKFMAAMRGQRRRSRLSLLTFCALLAGSSASGQGWVYFANYVPGVLTNAPVSGCAGLLQGTGYTAQLFGGPAGTADIDLTALTPQAPFRAAPSAGIVDGPFAGVVLPGVPAGQMARLQMRVWDNRGGTVTSWLAASGDATVQSGASPSFDSPPLTLQNTSEPVVLSGLRSFSICPLRLSAPVPVGNGVFSIRLTGVAGQSYAIQTASNLVNWLPLVTLTNVSGTVQFNVTNAPPLPARFYRARVGP